MSKLNIYVLDNLGALHIHCVSISILRSIYVCLSALRIVGPFFFDHVVNGSNYLDMLKEQFYPLVQDQEIYFQQHGAPAHYATLVRRWLDEYFTVLYSSG